MDKPPSEKSRELAEEIDEEAVGGILSASQSGAFGQFAPQRIGIAVVHKYLSSGKPVSFSVDDVFFACELEGHVFSKTEMNRMASRLVEQTEGQLPEVYDTIKEIKSKNGFEKRSLGFAFRPDEEEAEASVPEWIAGALFYQQPSERMIGPELSEMSARAFGRTFTRDGEVFVFDPKQSNLHQILAGIDITGALSQ